MRRVKLCFDIEFCFIWSVLHFFFFWLMKCVCSLFALSGWLLHPHRQFNCCQSDLGITSLNKSVFLRWTFQEGNCGGWTELPASDQRWRRASRITGRSFDPFTLKLHDVSTNHRADANCLETDHYVSAGLCEAVWQHSAAVLPKAAIDQWVSRAKIVFLWSRGQQPIILIVCEIWSVMALLAASSVLDLTSHLA